MIFSGVMIRHLCGSAAIEHLLNHRFEGFNGIAFGHILSRALDLIAFQRLCIVNRDGNFTAVCGQVFRVASRNTSPTTSLPSEVHL